MRADAKNAYVSMICGGDAYVPGAEALGRSLTMTGTPFPKVLMVTPDVTEASRARLVAEGWRIVEVTPIPNPHPERGLLFARFGNVFTKLHAWELTDYDKVVFLDADTIVVQKIDELFARPYFAAAPDFFVPDRFNSGVMVLEPSKKTFDDMMTALAGSASYDGGDQGFLNLFFTNWYAMPVEHRLTAGFNMHHFILQFLVAHPSLKPMAKEAKVIHYTMQKPWLTPTMTGGSELWWRMYYGVHPEAQHLWDKPVHALEDWSFDRLVGALIG
jgi:glycogenin glucosyltransferase